MSLLSDFFHGEIAPHEMRPSQEYESCSRQMEEYENRIRERMGDHPDIEQLIWDYALSTGRLVSVAAEENFIYGFELGAELMLEIMRES